MNKVTLKVRELGEKIPMSTGSDVTSTTMSVTPVRVVLYGNDYNELINKPQINGVELSGEISLEELGVQESMMPITEDEIYAIINGGEVSAG